jgi:dihydroorotate dehydrogenase (fumarate)
MNLATPYLGFQLAHPVMVGSSPLALDLDMVRRLEDAGASAITLPSLFEEQIRREAEGTLRDVEGPANAFPEALSYFVSTATERLGPDGYLEHLRKVKAAVDIPVIASLNGCTPAGWVEHALGMKEAGADALEINVYELATNPLETGERLERRTLEVIRMVKDLVDIPVAAKISPYFSSMAHFGKVMESTGVDAMILFNRFLQPDIDIESLDVVPTLELSTSAELLLRTRWLAILYSHIRTPMVATGGVHTATDAIKAIMAGATAVQVVSAILRHGPERLREIRTGMERWMEEHEYESLEQMRGSMSLMKCADPQALERANYMRVLSSWHHPVPLGSPAPVRPEAPRNETVSL